MGKKVLLTGNKGYIGSVLTEVLLEKDYNIVGFDTNFYEGIQKEKSNKIKQIYKDIRNISKRDLENVDSVIHLAALSNDPLGEFNPKLTEEINFRATINLAKISKEMGIKRFIYSSSQSMYGISKVEEELDEDDSIKNPLTTYAKTKWDAECGLEQLCSNEFTTVFFRPSTVFGVSPKLRCDIVYNSLLGCAYTTKKIEVKCDDYVWRPVIHVRDVCNAFISGLEAPKELVSSQAFNVGIENGNYTIKELAETVQKIVNGSSLVFTREHSDSRTYKVSFKKILSVLKDYYKPEWDLIKGGEELIDFFKKINFTEKMYRGRICNRFSQLKYLIKKNKLDENLFWKNKLNG